MRVDSKGNFVDKGSFFSEEEKRKKLDVLCGNASFDEMFLLNGSTDIICFPIKSPLEATDVRIKGAIENPSDYPDLVFHKERKQWFLLRVDILCLYRNPVDGEYTWFDRQCSGHALRTTVLRLSEGNSISPQLENNVIFRKKEQYQDNEAFLAIAEELEEHSFSLSYLKIAEDSYRQIEACPREEQPYRVYGGEINQYLYILGLPAVTGSALWNEYLDWKEFLARCQCSKICFDKQKGIVSFQHKFKRLSEESTEGYQLFIRNGKRGHRYALSDGSSWIEKQDCKEYLQEALSKNQLNNDFSNWFGIDKDLEENFRKNLSKPVAEPKCTNSYQLNFN